MDRQDSFLSYKIGLILGFHHHIPYGTGDEEFESVYTGSLKPFITALYKYPHIPAVLHYSGVLLYWIERNHPEFFMLLDDLISRKQIELLGGGFYEPMMTLLPPSDKIGQIEMLTTYIRKHFGKRPQGCWLPLSAWEQHMTGVLNTCGMGYTFLADLQFNRSGLAGEEIPDPSISEDQGKLVTIFPLSSRLKNELGRRRVSEVLDRLLGEFPPEKGGLFSVFPDRIFTGEGEGAAPETKMHRFLEDLSRAAENSSIELTLPGRYLKARRAFKKVYFSSSASRQFLITYPESNGLYAKMMFTHVLINQLRGDKSRKKNAREELWKAQGYNAFCHEGEGGIYRHNLRNASYQAMLEAERITREGGAFIPSLMIFDFDLDGEAEYLFQDNRTNYYIKTEGAAVFELDYLPKTWNYMNTLSRRRDADTEGPLAAGAPVEDGYRRAAFLDRLLPLHTTLEDVLENRFAGSRFCGNERYEPVELDKLQKKVRFRLSPKHSPEKGPAGTGFFRTIELEKTYRLKDDILTLTYSLKNQGDAREHFKFIPQIDFSFPGEGEPFLRVFTFNSDGKEAVPPGAGEMKQVRGIELQDLKNETILNLRSSGSFDLWITPIRTRCRVGGILRELYQSTCFMPVQEAALEPGEAYQCEFTLRIYH
ncbi:MAG: DUF1926 domain-containing protein [Spirochaetaceae bacterium]|nr:DUF1926 domain-containing protein [Spirochaetaceae bacterium]